MEKLREALKVAEDEFAELKGRNARSEEVPPAVLPKRLH
jgi:hypothetical protein